MKTFLLAVFFMLPSIWSVSFAQKKDKEVCRFVIKCDEKYNGKEVVITKIGIIGLNIKTTEKVRNRLTLFSEDKIMITEEALKEKINNICIYKSYYLEKIEFTFDDNANYKKAIPMIIRFHYTRS